MPAHDSQAHTSRTHWRLTAPSSPGVIICVGTGLCTATKRWPMHWRPQRLHKRNCDVVCPQQTGDAHGPGCEAAGRSMQSPRHGGTTPVHATRLPSGAPGGEPLSVPTGLPATMTSARSRLRGRGHITLAQAPRRLPAAGVTRVLSFPPNANGIEIQPRRGRVLGRVPSRVVQEERRRTYGVLLGVVRSI